MKSVATSTRRCLTLLALAGSALPAAAQTTLNVRIDGLPAGLTAAVGAELRCGAALVQTMGAMNLTEQTVVVWETAPTLGGGVQLVQRTRTSYTVPYRLPASFPACSDNRNLSFDLIVLGDRETRRSQIAAWDFSSTTLQVTMEAKTLDLVNRVNLTAQPLTAVARNVAQHWVATYRNKMGIDSVVEPTLDFLLPNNNFPLPGALFSHTRLSIDRDGAVCVRTGGATTCRAKALGGTLTVGGVAVDVRNTSHSSGGTSWRFTLLSGFPTGSFTVRAAANDFDSIEYLVDAEPTGLDLLPWKGLSLPLLVNP